MSPADETSAAVMSDEDSRADGGADDRRASAARMAETLLSLRARIIVFLSMSGSVWTMAERRHSSMDLSSASNRIRPAGSTHSISSSSSIAAVLKCGGHASRCDVAKSAKKGHSVTEVDANGG